VARVQTYASLARDILSRKSVGSRLVAVDGPGAAGKSVFAARLAAALGDAPIVHTDDFATGEPGDEWWPRLQAQVLDPVLRGDSARFRRYDWHRRTLAEWQEVPPGPAIVIDGVTSARREVSGALALAVWVHTLRAVRLERGLDRDGEAARALWNRWMADEDTHFRSDETIARCEILADGAPNIPHDPGVEFVRLDSCAYE
jgi:uridine kinase